MALCLLPLSACTSLFFFPMQQHVTTPAALGYEHEDVWLESSDSTQLHGWLITPEQQIIGTVYFLHGNAENVSTHFRAILWLVNAGYQVFALDYRGYGLSQGKPDVPEVFEDIAAGAQWLYQHHNGNTENKDKPIVLFGQSLGASLALKFAQLYENFNEQFDALITEAAFSRYGHIARHVADQQWITWWAQYPAQWLIPDDHDPMDAVSQYNNLPLLMIHSRDDEIIPYTMGRSLFDAAAEPKQWVSTTGQHIRAAADPNVRQAILQFIEQSQNRF